MATRHDVAVADRIDLRPATGGGSGTPPDAKPKSRDRGRRPASIARRRRRGTALGAGLATLYLSLIVLIPLAAVVWRSRANGIDGFWRAVSNPQAWSALKLTIGASLVVALINVVMGTL